MTITVTPGKTDKDITAFSFTKAANNSLTADITSEIKETNIAITVPYGTNVTALKASFTTTGISVTVNGAVQTSGTTANDFTSAVTYRVTAEDGTTQDYEVTLILKVTRAQLLEMISNNENVTKVDTSEITDMSSLFENNTSFNQDIGNWDVSNVFEMAGMFYGATAFNQDISSWTPKNGETTTHTNFSGNSCPLTKENHPYESWND